MEASQGQAAARRPAFFVALLSRFAQIVGEGAAGATFHFAAMQEGMGIGKACTLAQGDQCTPEEALVSAHEHLGIDARLREADPYEIEFAGDHPLLAQTPLAHAVLMGYYEGVLRSCHGTSFETSIQDGPPVRIRLARRVSP